MAEYQQGKGIPGVNTVGVAIAGPNTKSRYTKPGEPYLYIKSEKGTTFLNINWDEFRHAVANGGKNTEGKFKIGVARFKAGGSDGGGFRQKETPAPAATTNTNDDSFLNEGASVKPPF